MENDLNHLYFIFEFRKSPHSVTISFAKGTFKDMIRKVIILNAAEAGLRSPNSWEHRS